MKRFLIIIGFSIISSLFVFFLFLKQVQFLQTIDLKLQDVRFKIRKNIIPDNRIVIAAIDTKSINKLGRFPWDRKIFAELITILKKFYKVKVIAFDVVFSEKSNLESDEKLANAIKNAGNVVLGYFFRENKDIINEESEEILEEKAGISNIEVSPDVKKIPIKTFPYAELNIPLISKHAKSFGFFNIFADKDGIIRKATLLINYDGIIYPSLPLEALKVFTNKKLKIRVEDFGIEGIYIGKRKIPCDEFGRLALNYYGPQGIFKTFSIYDLLKKKVPKKKLKNSIVFIGATEIGIADIRATPVDPTLPGVEIHATVASNFLQNMFLIRNGFVVFTDIVSIFIFSIIFGMFLFFIRKTFFAFLSLIFIILIYSIYNFLLFTKFHYNVSIIYPYVAIILTYFLSEAYRNLIEERHSRFLKKAFSSYVSPQLVNVIVENPSLLKLGGETREVSILFSDIRGFTTISENLSPEKLVEILNEYLGPMTEIVFKNYGTLDKYIGDAIMAIFNAPVEIKNHEYWACKTALEMIDSLSEINKKFKEKNYPEIDIGIGINSGKVVAGNMGTDIRFDYTVIGDNVNLASRLEGLNKLFGTKIIISENTYKKVKEKFICRELDLIKVKGKKKGVKIYELNKNLSEELIINFENALKLYRKKQFDKALIQFKNLYEKFKDKPSFEFIKRCEFFLNNKVPENWDGIYEAKVK